MHADGHVIARVKEGISLPFDGEDRGWLPDGSRLTWLNAPSGKKEERLPVRAAEHNVLLPRGDGTEEASETCTLITTLLDHRAAPADAMRETYLTRWSASETTFGEDKTMITGAGNRTSGPVLRSGSPRLVIQKAWAWLTATQLIRARAAAALRSREAAARALRRRTRAPVTANEESFTAVRHHAIRSMATAQVTASSSLNALAAASDAAARAALHTLTAVRQVLAGKTLVDAGGAVEVERALPHGHAAAVHAMARSLGLPALLGPPGPARDLAYALVVSRVIRPRSKLSTLGWWQDVTLGTDLGVAGASTDEIYAAMDWLAGRPAGRPGRYREAAGRPSPARGRDRHV